jgi:hypothetical protein
MTETPDHDDDGEDWIGALIEQLEVAAMNLDYAEDIYPAEILDTKPLFKGADAAFSDALDALDGMCIHKLRELVGRLAFRVAQFIEAGARDALHAEELQVQLAEQDKQRWLDGLAVPVPVSPDQLELPELAQEDP